MTGLNTVGHYSGPFKQAEEMGRKGLRIARDTKHLPTMAVTELSMAVIFATKFEGQKTIKHAEAALKIIAELGGVSIFQPLCHCLASTGHRLLADLESAADCANKALQIQNDMGLQMYLSLLYINYAATEMELGNFIRAKSYAEKGLVFAQKNDEKIYEMMAWMRLGTILGKLSPADFSKAEECILAGIKLAEEMKYKPRLALGFYFVGNLYNHMGRKEESLTYLKKAEAMFKEMEIDYYLNKIQEALHRL